MLQPSIFEILITSSLTVFVTVAVRATSGTAGEIELVLHLPRERWSEGHTP